MFGGGGGGSLTLHLCPKDIQIQACHFLLPKSLASLTREAGWGTATHLDSRLRFHHPVPSSCQTAEIPTHRGQLIQSIDSGDPSPGVECGTAMEGTLAWFPWIKILVH